MLPSLLRFELRGAACGRSSKEPRHAPPLTHRARQSTQSAYPVIWAWFSVLTRSLPDLRLAHTLALATKTPCKIYEPG